MTRSGVGVKHQVTYVLTYVLTYLLTYLAPHLAEHAWPGDSGPQKFNAAVQSLVTHVAVERCEDIKLQNA